MNSKSSLSFILRFYVFKTHSQSKNELALNFFAVTTKSLKTKTTVTGDDNFANISFIIIRFFSLFRFSVTVKKKIIDRERYIHLNWFNNINSRKKNLI